MTEPEEALLGLAPSERVLLLSHCMRPSQTCPGKFTKTGLNCPDNCMETCNLNEFRRAALLLGYKGVCIAAGGAMALRFVKGHNPRGIVAVACDKELVEGVTGVKGLAADEQGVPAIVVIPLLKDGCVDTEVDVARVLGAIAAGCSPSSASGDGQKT